MDKLEVNLGEWIWHKGTDREETVYVGYHDNLSFDNELNGRTTSRGISPQELFDDLCTSRCTQNRRIELSRNFSDEMDCLPFRPINDEAYETLSELVNKYNSEL